jgi:signal transduction histidine kinase/ligand-binding sensor domain-containing protein
MHKRVNFTVNLFLLAAFVVIPFVPVTAQLNPANLNQYTEKDGVPASQVAEVLVDKFGYIWLGSINGLSRYDGYEFQRFYSNPNDSVSIRGLVVSALFEDRKGYIWVSTGPEKLDRYDPATKSFRHYNYAHLIDHAANTELVVYTISQDQNGRLYFGITTNYGDNISEALLYLEEKEDKIKKFEHKDSLKIQNVYKLTSDKEGKMWILGYEGLQYIDLDGKLNQVRTSDLLFQFQDEYPTDMEIDEQGHIWFVTNLGRLCDFQPAIKKITNYTPLDLTSVADGFFANNLLLDKDQKIWIGTNRGLKLFDRKLKQFDYFRNEGQMNVDPPVILDMKIDSFGTLWIGTGANGLLKYEERLQLKSFSFSKGEQKSITPGWVNNLYENSEGYILMSTSAQGSAAGLNILNVKENTIQPIPFKNILSGMNHIAGFREISPGELLLSTNLGLYQYSLRTNEIKKTTIEGYANPMYINYFYTDKKQNDWLCTNSGLYRKSKNQKSYSKYDISKLEGANAGSNEITRVFESDKHGLWLLTNNGLFLFDYATEKIIRHGYDKTKGDIFITQDINSFYEDASGTAWIGTWQGGLSRYSIADRKIKYYTRNDGLPSMSIQGILSDEDSKTLWLSTFEGLCRFNIETGRANSYSIADGIQSQLFADGSNLKTSKGLFIFGGSNGITVFRPADFSKSSTPPRVFITDIKLFNKSLIPGQSPILKNGIYDTKEIALAYNQNNISLDFIALHYSNPAKNKFAYKLENYDIDWREVGNQHEAFYPKLPPGKYVFRVKAANNNGVWNEEGASLSITVLSPWWQTLWAYAVYAIAFLGLGFLGNRYMRQRLLSKERERSQAKELAQAKEIEKAYHKLEETHETLKATQSQLIQSEKMASLGELTAGIAHEIQNPLNFINNFSEINTELIDELNEGIESGNMDEVKSIALDIRENEKKINHHGKRADAIVKGMLQHSRVSSGQKEPADINALVDEYIRLSYHGLRAKDKSFNATLKSELDQSLGDIQIVPQDIGRVLLNLLNNAFFSVTEKSKKNIAGFEPTVSVITKNLGDKVRISVQDNGMGIPAEIRDKIFQPFFTTKSSGQGTGLGLSLSYDIVKAHGGEIRIDSVPNTYTIFDIELPV